jgi:hypothetical protein
MLTKTDNRHIFYICCTKILWMLLEKKRGTLFLFLPPQPSEEKNALMDRSFGDMKVAESSDCRLDSCRKL